MRQGWQIVVIFWAGFTIASSYVILEVPNYGILNGTEETSTHTERPFFAFRSVFYAEKPTNLTRFLPPVPKAPYSSDEVQQATTNNLGCPQPLGSEDCLSVNVYTPNLPSKNGSTDLLPVMFWIHGGGFSFGHALEYLPGRYMEHDVVLVVVQYRLGPLGFLTFDTDEAPGNAGIFDQIEALRWVNRNIEYFGGDPNQITIAGESAGSASVTLLLLAPQARGLFQRAIGQSGSVLAEWALDRDGRGNRASRDIAARAGCPTEPYAELLDCVRNVDPHELLRAFRNYSSNDMVNGGLGFSGSNPVIQIAGQERIIEVEPQLLFDSGNYAKVPVMFGANKQEGVLVLALLYEAYLKPNGLENDTTFLAEELVPTILRALHINDPTGELAADLIQKHLAGAEMGNFTSMTPGLTDMCSVLFLKGPTYRTMQSISRNSGLDSFFYSFEFEGRNSLYVYLFVGDYPPIPHGVNHADELIYLFIFPFPSIPPGLNGPETEVSKKMLQTWTNFVKYGNPTPAGVELLPGIPNVPPYEPVMQSYLEIDSEWLIGSDYTTTYTITVDELDSASRS